MNVGEGFRQSFETIRHNKLRTALTMLGMNIGVASVIAVMAIGLMSRGAIMRGIENIGSTLLWVRANYDAYAPGAAPVLLRPQDVEGIEALFPEAWVTPLLRTSTALGYRGYQEMGGVYGVGPDYLVVWARELEAGRFLEGRDTRERRRVIVLGRNTARALFETPEAALGEGVSLRGRVFEVVGVMAEKDRSPVDDGSDDDTSFVTFEALEAVTDWGPYGGPRVPTVQLKVAFREDVDWATGRLERFLAERYAAVEGKPRFIVRRAEDSIRTTNRVFDIITTVITLIAGISLLVGGIGIMNIMLVTVTERTREIGIRKALGAKRRDILGQFLIESVIICMIGGGLGIVLGVGVTAMVSVLQSWEYLLPWFAVAVGLVVSISIGLFFGIWPAMKAARLDPVVALTRE